jgi:hypothetical protein
MLSYNDIYDHQSNYNLKGIYCSRNDSGSAGLPVSFVCLREKIPCKLNYFSCLLTYLTRTIWNTCVNGTSSVCDQKTSKFFVLPGRIHGRTYECKWSLLNIRQRKIQRENDGHRWSLLADKACFSS